MRPYPSLESISECLKNNYAVSAASITPISGGADIDASLFKAETADQSYFLKLKKGNPKDVEVVLLALLYKSGIKEIIPPIQTLHGSSMQRVDDFSIRLYPFIEGVNGFSQKLSVKQWMALGKALRQVHDFKVPSSLLKSIRHENYSPKCRETVRSFYSHIQDKPNNKDDIALKFLSVMKENRAVIEKLINQAEELSFTIRKPLSQFVLCHSDIHGGNILINETGNLYIVDWDDPIMAPKERDLMFIGGGVANVWNDPKEEAFFYKGYGETEINKFLLAYYRNERIVQDIAEFADVLFLNETHKDRREMLKHFINMFNANGVVDIALKTL